MSYGITKYRSGASVAGAVLLAAIIASGCNGGGGDDNNGSDSTDVFDAASYGTATPGSDLSGQWIALVERTLSYGSMVDGEFVATHVETRRSREVLSIDKSGDDTVMTLCGREPQQLLIDGDQAQFFYGNDYLSSSTLDIVDNSHMSASNDSGVLKASPYSAGAHWRHTSQVTMLRINSDGNASIGTIDLAWSNATNASSGSRQEAVECFIEQQRISTIDNEVADNTEPTLDTATHALYVVGTDTEWAYDNGITSTAEISQNIGWIDRLTLENDNVPSGLATTLNLFLLDPCPFEINFCLGNLRPIPGGEHRLNAHQQATDATEAEIADITSAHTPLFVRQQYDSDASSISGRLALTADDGDHIEAQLDLAW